MKSWPLECLQEQRAQRNRVVLESVRKEEITRIKRSRFNRIRSAFVQKAAKLQSDREAGVVKVDAKFGEKQQV